MMDGMTEPAPGARIGSFAALGDSFSEGLNDLYPSGGYRGWADRVAEVLAAQTPGFGYANLAISGKLLGQVIAEQVPHAARMAPDLVSLAAGGNDILRRTDVDELAAQFEHAVTVLQSAGSRVLIFTGFDPRMFPVIRLLRGRIAAYDMHLRAIADTHGCDLVDLWSMRSLHDLRAWSPDRLHLSPEGHRRVARRTCEVLGIPAPDDAAPGAEVADQGNGIPSPAANGSAPEPAQHNQAARSVWLAARRRDAHWARQYAMPWVRRRLTGAESESTDPKRPALLPVDPGGLSP
jgi:lysophospholipase L1-like esterase